MSCHLQMLQLCTVCPPKQTSCTFPAHGTLTPDRKGQSRNTTVLWTVWSDWASTKVLLSCLQNATRSAIHQAVCIFCVQQREFAVFCCLSTRSRKDGEEGTICHSITWSCGRSRTVNKTANKSTHTQRACFTSLKEILVAPLVPHFAKTSSNAVVWYLSQCAHILDVMHVNATCVSWLLERHKAWI